MEAFAYLVFSCAIFLAVLVLARFLLGGETYGKGVAFVAKGVAWIYAEAKEIIGTVGRRGWRPLIPWLFGALVAVIILRIANGQSLPDVPALTSAIVPLAGTTGFMAWFRSREALNGLANDGTTGSPLEGRSGPAQP